MSSATISTPLVAPAVTAPAKPQTTVRGGRVPTVDALRGLASLSVCFFHLSLTTLPDSWLKTIGAQGHYGVQVFFVISGFIVPYSLWAASYEFKNYPRFVLRRGLRLDPPYLATILIATVLAYAATRTPGYAGPPFNISVKQVLLHLGFLNVFFGGNWIVGVFWTLAVEFQYYVLIGLLFPLLMSPKWFVRTALFLALGASAFAVRDTHFLPRWLFLFMMGMVAFQARAGVLDKKSPAFFAHLAVMLAGGILTVGITHSMVGLVSALIIAYLNFGSRVLGFFATISYSLYLIHMPVGLKAVNLLDRFSNAYAARLLILVIGVAISVAAAWALYFAAERPALILASKIRYRPRA